MLPLVPVAVSPPELKHRAERLSTRLHPGLRAWIDRQAREEAGYPHFDERRLRQALARRFQSQADLSEGEADVLVFLVLKAAADVTEQELRQAMEILRDADEQRRASRAALAEFLETRALLKAPPPERAHLRIVPPVSDDRLRQLDEIVDGAALKLQLMTDRRSKVLTALFGVLRRLSGREHPGLRRLR